MIVAEGSAMTVRQREAFKKLIARHTRETTTSAEVARASLIQQGIYTKDGQLAPEYTPGPRDTSAA